MKVKAEFSSILKRAIFSNSAQSQARPISCGLWLYLGCTECARDPGPCEVKNAETQMLAGKVKYAYWETQIHAGKWAWALNFGEFVGSYSI